MPTPVINTASKVQWLLCFTFSYAQLITQCYRRKTVEEVPLQQSSHTTICAPPTVSKKLSISYCLKSAVAIILHFQLCSAHYTALQTKNSAKIVSATNPITTEIWTVPIYKRTVEKPRIVLQQINTLGCQKKEMGHKEGQT